MKNKTRVHDIYFMSDDCMRQMVALEDYTQSLLDIHRLKKSSKQDSDTIKNLQFHNRGLAEALREKHNRDVELTDLLAEIGEKYAHVFTPQELGRIKKLTCDDS